VLALTGPERGRIEKLLLLFADRESGRLSRRGGGTGVTSRCDVLAIGHAYGAMGVSRGGARAAGTMASWQCRGWMRWPGGGVYALALQQTQDLGESVAGGAIAGREG
jgi:hypothetical protein